MMISAFDERVIKMVVFKKKYIVFIPIAFLLFCLSACGKKEKTNINETEVVEEISVEELNPIESSETTSEPESIEESENIKESENIDVSESISEQVAETINPFWFPMNGDQYTKEVYFLCTYNYDNFKGKATLYVDRMTGFPLEQYYRVYVKDFVGECDDMFGEEECPYNEEIEIGYFFVDTDGIYYMWPHENYFEVFAEIEQFPPTDEYVEAYQEARLAKDIHDGMFGYKLVCSDDREKDTFDMTEEELANLLPGTNYIEGYHNRIIIDDDKRIYGLVQDEDTWGTPYWHAITWEEGKGITYYSEGSGALRDYINISDEPMDWP